MPITPKNLIYHELIGLPVWVYRINPAESSQSPVVGGVVVDETHQMLVVETSEKKRKWIIKQTHKFRFTLPQPGGPVVVEVDGNLLWGRPEKRLKRMRKIRGH
ncbi:MAG TPA: ribonuclease P protein subunit [Candidatus Lokiarchaeia archaeon]|nr:ribonuclease P protein subunit [Candidatus Lokiarchaeia archaeon]